MFSNLYVPAFLFELSVRVIKLSIDVSYILFDLYKLKVKNIITTLVSDDTYVFLNNSAYPHKCNIDTLILTKPSLLYNMNTNTFYPWNHFIQHNKLFNLGKSKVMPILSLEITDKSGKILYDLTDFISRMRYNKLYSLYSTPTIAHIISVWQIYSSIILDHSEVSVNYINLNGDTVSTSILDLNNI
jgi:hypothetical protein